MLFVTVATAGVTIWLYIVVPKGFFPEQDTGLMQGATVADPSHVVRRHGGAPARGGGRAAAGPGGGGRRAPSSA